jgi:hypothetical protein
VAKTEDEDLAGRIGPIEVDWPRSVGHHGGVALAVALEIIDWSVGLFLATIPMVKLPNWRPLPRAVRFPVQVFEGMSKPVGGDAEGTLRMVRTPQPLKEASEREADVASPRPRRPRARRPGTEGGNSPTNTSRSNQA